MLINVYSKTCSLTYGAHMQISILLSTLSFLSCSSQCETYNFISIVFSVVAELSEQQNTEEIFARQYLKF